MKKILTFLVITITFFGCSNNDDLKNNPNSTNANPNSIIGKWKFYEKLSNDGTNQNLDECQQKSNITYKKDNTFSVFYFGKRNGNCQIIDEIKNGKYKVESNFLTITHTTSSNGQTNVHTKRVKIKFPDKDTLEIYEINEDGTIKNKSKDTWKREK